MNEVRRSKKGLLKIWKVERPSTDRVGKEVTPFLLTDLLLAEGPWSPRILLSVVKFFQGNDRWDGMRKSLRGMAFKRRPLAHKKRIDDSDRSSLTNLLTVTVMEAIPSIVCDTLYSMGLADQTPSWKIMDSKGRISVVLTWEKEGAGALMLTGPTGTHVAPSRQSSICSTTIAAGGPRMLGVHARSISQVRMIFQKDMKSMVIFFLNLALRVLHIFYPLP